MCTCKFYFVGAISLMLLATIKARSPPSSPAKKDSHALATAVNYFGLGMLEQLSKDSRNNIFFSPYSLSSVLGMLYYGAKGDTAQELNRLLGYKKAKLEDAQVHSAFQRFISKIAKNVNNRNFTLSSANSILINKKAGILSQYKTEVQHLYNAFIREEDFYPDTQRVISEVNRWAKEKTMGKIESVLDTLNPNSVMILLNAVYFKANWKTKFDVRNTKTSNFYNFGDKSQVVKVPTMHLIGRFPHAEFDGGQVLELPYTGGNISMLIILPDRGTRISDIQNTLNIERLKELQDKMHTKKVEVSLPKFKLSYSKELSKEVSALGATKIFTPGGNFGNMTTSRNMVVSQIYQRAIVVVNEEGSEALAVTRSVFRYVTAIKLKTAQFKVNRPFIFAIIDKESRLMFFIGLVKSL